MNTLERIPKIKSNFLKALAIQMYNFVQYCTKGNEEITNIAILQTHSLEGKDTTARIKWGAIAMLPLGIMGYALIDYKRWLIDINDKETTLDEYRSLALLSGTAGYFLLDIGEKDYYCVICIKDFNNCLVYMVNDIDEFVRRFQVNI